ncbi:VTT domain-containing protein [Neobacillus novalis]|uniref:VTT domain-containing protein n=1 Tax=Neobacillus novalis TaxID=220687 RepID=A0AA95MRN0_9BACI|nr:VTT domain-containing protein [Neobacillus novalis]WHY87219.1 VTT domain-containing protein [Neobacillus novalis]
MGVIKSYMDQYGYVLLLIALMLELLALPLPGELIMSYTGFLVYQGHLGWFTSIFVAGVGSSIGMTIAYWIGLKFGTVFFEKYGRKFHLGPERLENTSKWFSKYGNKLLIIAYFIPGVRHFTGYFSGITHLKFRTYALYAYSGAFIWVATFISLGKVLGPKWDQFHASIKKYLLIGIIIALFILVIVYVYRRKKEQIKGAAILGINRMMKLLKSRKRTGIFIVCTVVITLVLSILMIEVIQSLLNNEFQEFDETMTYLVPATFGQEWTPFMQIFSFMGNSKVLFIICACSFLWIIWKGRNKVLESIAWLLIISGGELYEESLIRLFHSLTLPEQTSAARLFHKFPSEQPLMAFVIYGFAVFVFVRHTHNVRVHSAAAAGTLLLLLLIAVSRIFLSVQDPSDILVEYIFGGVWLSLNILVLEMFRLLRIVHIDVKTNK